MITNFDEHDHHFFMMETLKEAEEAGKHGDRPIGTVIVHNGTIISRGSNRINTLKWTQALVKSGDIFTTSTQVLYKFYICLF